MKLGKITALLLVAVMLLTMSSLTVSAQTKSYFIGYSTLTTQGDFMALLATVYEQRFTALGHKFQVASADLNPAKQIEQIENFIALGVDGLIVMAVEPSSLDDVLKRAQDKGIKIIAFSQPTAYYDVFLGADDLLNGKVEAEMAAEWIEKTFPDAADGSIEVAVFENRDKPSAANRSDGLKEIVNLTKKAKLVATVPVDTSNASGQAAAENLLLTNPDVKVIISYNADTAMGVDAYVMSMNSAVKDKSTFATFSTDFNPAASDAIKKSVNNESIWRGTIMMGSSLEAMFNDVVGNTLAALDGTLTKKDAYTELFKVTPENVEAADKGEM